MKTLSKLAMLVSALLAGTGALAADWSSNSIGYRYAPTQSEPGVSDKVSKNILSFTHISGDNFTLQGLVDDATCADADGGDPGHAGRRPDPLRRS